MRILQSKDVALSCRRMYREELGMKNFKVGKKLAISYIIIMLLLILGSAVSVANIVRVGEKMESFYEGPFTVRGSVSSIRANFESMQKSVYRTIAYDDMDIMETSISDVSAAQKNIENEMLTLKEHFTGDKQTIETLAEHLESVYPIDAEVLDMAVQFRNQEALKYKEDNTRATNTKIREELDNISSYTDETGVNLIAEVRNAQQNSIIILVLLGGLSVGISVAFAFYITHSITRPISELEKAAEHIADGKLKEVSVTYRSEDEMGGLAESMRVTISRFSFLINDLTYLLGQVSEGNFNIVSRGRENYVGEFYPLLTSIQQTIADLSNTVKQINSSSEQVAGGAEQVSYGAQALAVGSSEQATTIETLADTISSLADKIGSNAYDASNASKKAGVVGREMEESNERMKRMLSAMDDISDSSTRIKKIIDTIEEITSQTNILALNAKVEAARAGASGKGFAVIADEVQQLSAKSKEATRDTSELVDESLRAVENGLVIANETAESLQNVVSGVKEIVSAVGSISDATSEQAESVEQITRNITQISNIVQSNSATAEESAAASEELSGQAEMLKSLVRTFKLKVN